MSSTRRMIAEREKGVKPHHYIRIARLQLQPPERCRGPPFDRRPVHTQSAGNRPEQPVPGTAKYGRAK